MKRLAGSPRALWPILRGSVAYGLGPALGLLSGPILARALGPEGRGQFASIMEPITLAGAVASLGIPAAVAYFSAQGARAGAVYRKGLVLSALPAVFTFGALCWYAVEVSSQQSIPVSVLVCCWAVIFPSAVIQIRRGYWQGQGQWRRLDSERFAFALLRFAVVCCLAFIGFKTAPIFAMGSLMAFCAAAMLLWFSPSGTVYGRGSTSFSAVARYSLGASLGTIAVVANNRLDQVLLPLVSPSQELGYYSIAVTVAEVPLVFGALAARNALHESGKGSSSKRVFLSVAPFMGFSVAISALLAVVAPGLVPLFFGASFEPSIAAVQVLVVGTALACFSMVTISLISGRGRPAISSFIPLSGLVVTVAGFATVGNSMTSTAAAYISMVSQAVSLIVGLIIVAHIKGNVGDSSADSISNKVQRVVKSGRKNQ